MQMHSNPGVFEIKDKDTCIISVNSAGVQLHLEYSPYFTEGTLEEIYSFLNDRVFSPSRRDRESILYVLNLSDYNVLEIAKRTHAFSMQDTLWLSTDATAYQDALDTFLLNFQNESYSPGGVNIKHYLKEGVVKKRLSPMHSDAEMEVACYRLGKLLGMPVCKAEMLTADSVLSYFEYNIFQDKLVHVRHLIDMSNRNLYEELCKWFDNTWISNLVVFDFITRQDDRHMSNLATVNGELYPLYDNGRSLFYEDTPLLVSEALSDVKTNATSFGNIGTYWDYAQHAQHTLRLEALDAESARSCFEGLDIPSYRLDGAVAWILLAKEALLKNGTHALVSNYF